MQRDHSTIDVAAFREIVYGYYAAHGRHDLLWRQPEPDGRFDPYKILVSEIMLQQTQVDRVTPKFIEFVGQFSTVQTLAEAPLGAVLRAWSGLGYNRRAKFLQEAARMITETYGGVFPTQTAELVALPGVGVNTAGAVQAYAFNMPVSFIETNIRSVFLYHFFATQAAVADRAILDLVTLTLDTANPRIWCWGLMDYGSHLKQTKGNPNAISKSYVKQSRFIGSRRQIRGQLIRLLGERSYTMAELKVHITDARLDEVVQQLTHEGLIHKTGVRYSL